MIAAFAMNCGIFVWPLALLAAAIIVLSARAAHILLAAARRTEDRATPWLDGILFCGAFSALLGILGQAVIIYHSFEQVRSAGIHVPFPAATAIAETFAATIFGLVNLSVAAPIWFGMRAYSRNIGLRRAGASARFRERADVQPATAPHDPASGA
jgi:hypothetical protein